MSEKKVIVENYQLSSKLREQLVIEIGKLYKQNAFSQQALRDQQTQSESELEAFFLELLEVVDSLDGLLNFLSDNPEPSSDFVKRLPKSIGAVQRKLLNILKKRHVNLIDLEEAQQDYITFRVVDRELNNALPDKTIIKIIRQGYRFKDKILRPAEVITSKLE